MKRCLLVILLIALPCFGATKGLYLSIDGDPSPTLFGLNGFYQWSSFSRVEGGFGYLGAGAGAIFFWPEWELTPTIGVHASYTRAGGVWGASGYLNFGALMSASSGKFLEAGVNCEREALSGNWGACTPYLNLGLAL